MKYMKFSTLVLTLLTFVGFSGPGRAATIAFDFSQGLAYSGGVQQNKNLIVDKGYQFEAPDIGDYFIGNAHGINWGYGLTTSASPVAVSISRTDGHVFNLEGLTVFIGGILVGGASDFEVTPFDAAGNEGNPVIFSAGQFWTQYVKTGTQGGQDVFSTPAGQNIFSMALGPFSSVSQLKIGGGVGYFTAFSFSSAFDAAPVSQVPLPTASWLFLSALMGGLALTTRKS